MSAETRFHVGQKIAPPRFLMFLAIFAVSVAVGSAMGFPRLSLLCGFDLASLTFLISALPLLDDSAGKMRESATRNDANRSVLLAITSLICTVILFAIGTLIADKQNLHVQGVVLVVGTLLMAWFFSNTVFALHYAHLFYLQHEEGEGDKGDKGGLDFPGTEEPDYWDFLYFSFTLGMTFQTSDTGIKSGRIRKTVLGHSMAAFIFNMGVLAFTVNALGGM